MEKRWPRKDNYCEIDPSVVDKYGIPVLRFHTKYTDYEIKQAKHMKETFSEIMHSMGAVITWGGDDGPENNYGLHAPGNIIHEAGTVRMGNDPKKSPLNKWARHMIAKIYLMLMAACLYHRPIKILPGQFLLYQCALQNILLIN